jgi:hypothetical protein
MSDLKLELADDIGTVDNNAGFTAPELKQQTRLSVTIMDVAGLEELGHLRAVLDGFGKVVSFNYEEYEGYDLP